MVSMSSARRLTNDAADAEAICDAVGRQNMRFVPVKNIEQQSILAVHRIRQSFVQARTAQANQIRGLLGEFALVLLQYTSYCAESARTTGRRRQQRAARIIPAHELAPARSPKRAGQEGSGIGMPDRAMAPRTRRQQAAGTGSGDRTDHTRPADWLHRRLWQLGAASVGVLVLCAA